MKEISEKDKVGSKLPKNTHTHTHTASTVKFLIVGGGGGSNKEGG